jgi:Ca-activated chloride channel family protein
MAIVQLGFGVDMNLDEFRRPALNLAVVVDVSGSMRGGKTEATKKALEKLLDQLDEKDRVALVLFDHSAWVPFPSAVCSPENLAKAREVVEKEVYARGSTNIEAGLRFGYEQVAAHAGEPGRSPRVFLMTDARPNVGTTGPHGFKTMMAGAAALGIGLGAFGVGIDFGQELAYEIFQTRNANYFFLEDEEKIAKVFDEEFVFMVTPAAHDVLVMMVPAGGAEIVDVMGVSDYRKGAEGTEMRIPSLFFSKRQGGGATLVALKLAAASFDRDVELAFVDLSFAPVGARHKVRQRLEVFLPSGLDPSGATPYYSQAGVKKALMLAEMATAMKTACAGHTAPAPDDLFWTVPTTRRGAEEVQAPPRRRGGDVVAISAEKARKAATGLGKFCDWFAGQASGFGTASAGEVGFDALEPELRLMEKLEQTLCRTAGVQPPQARTIPAVVAPETAPPALEIF